MQLGNGTAIMSEDGGWDDSNFAFEYWCGSWDTPQNVNGYPLVIGVERAGLGPRAIERAAPSAHAVLAVEHLGIGSHNSAVVAVDGIA